MSDAIEIGAKRRVQSIARPRKHAIGKRQKPEPLKEPAEPEQRPARSAEDKPAQVRSAKVKSTKDRPAKKRPAKSRPIGSTVTKLPADGGEVELGRFTGRSGVAKRRKLARPKVLAEPEQRPAGSAEDKLAQVRSAKVKSAKNRPAKNSPPGSTAEKLPADGGEVELGRFTGRSGQKSPKRRRAAGSSEVVGPKRQKADPTKAEARPEGTGFELQIAVPRDISEDAAPSRKRATRRSRPAADGMESWNRIGALVFFSVVLVIFTVATFLLLPRYQTLGDPLIADPAFESGLADWEQAGLVTHEPEQPSTVSLTSSDATTRTYLTRDLELPPGKTLLVLSAQVRGDDVQPGPEVWDRARIYLAQLDADGQPDWAENHELFGLEGTTDVRNYSRTFSIPAEIETVRLGIELKNTTGQLTVSRLELAAAERPSVFMIAVSWLLLGWGALTLYAMMRTLKGIDSPRIRLWFGITCSLAVGALMLPGSFHDVWTHAIAGPLGLEHADFDTIGHGVMFAILAFLVRLGRPQPSLWLHAGAWLLIAVASEVLQLLTVDREPSADDLMLDAIGILVGLTLAEAMRLVQRFRKA